MKPIEFKGQNVIYGKDQPEYLPLPALSLGDEQGTVITCWQFTDEEFEDMVKNKCFYLKQLTFNQPLHPIRPMANLGDDISFIGNG